MALEKDVNVLKVDEGKSSSITNPRESVSTYICVAGAAIITLSALANVGLAVKTVILREKNIPAYSQKVQNYEKAAKRTRLGIPAGLAVWIAGIVMVGKRKHYETN